MEPETSEIRKQIIEAAIRLYIDDHDRFNMKRIAQEAGLKPSEIYRYFDGKYEILYSFYNNIVPEYRAMIKDIDDFHTYSAGEKISNFIYTSFDLFGEQEAFVQKTYHSFTYCPTAKTHLKKDIYNLLRNFLEQDEQIPGANKVFLNAVSYSALTTKFLLVIEYWLNDKSESKEKSMVLVDKLTALFDELIYNSMLDKSLDLLKFFIADWGLEKTLSSVDQHITDFFKRFEHII